MPLNGKPFPMVIFRHSVKAMRLLDVIGPQRLREFSERSASKLKRGSRFYPAVILACTLCIVVIIIVRSVGHVPRIWAYLVALLVGLAYYAGIRVGTQARRGLVWIFEHDRVASTVRIVSMGSIFGRLSF
jgi:hypothetical protein